MLVPSTERETYMRNQNISIKIPTFTKTTKEKRSSFKTCLLKPLATFFSRRKSFNHPPPPPISSIVLWPFKCNEYKFAYNYASNIGAHNYIQLLFCDYSCQCGQIRQASHVKFLLILQKWSKPVWSHVLALSAWTLKKLIYSGSLSPDHKYLHERQIPHQLSSPFQTKPNCIRYIIGVLLLQQ